MEPVWDDIRIFLSVARSESLTGAGKALKRDPATIGRRIARLEEASHARLFSKSPKGYQLTQAGERFLVHAEQAEQALSLGFEATATEKGGLSGQVRIGATDGCASYVLPQVCAEVSRNHPDLELQIVAVPRVVNLTKREADLAVTVSPPKTGRLKIQKIADYRLHLAASKSYLERYAPIRHLNDLKQHSLIGYVPDMIYLPELDFLSVLELDPPKLASNLVAVQLGFLRNGAGIGVTHDFVMPFAPELRKVLADEVSFTRSFYLVRHADDLKVERLARVADALKIEMAQEIARLEAQA